MASRHVQVKSRKKRILGNVVKVIVQKNILPGSSSFIFKSKESRVKSQGPHMVSSLCSMS